MQRKNGKMEKVRIVYHKITSRRELNEISKNEREFLEVPLVLYHYKVIKITFVTTADKRLILLFLFCDMVCFYEG